MVTVLVTGANRGIGLGILPTTELLVVINVIAVCREAGRELDSSRGTNRSRDRTYRCVSDRRTDVPSPCVSLWMASILNAGILHFNGIG